MKPLRLQSPVSIEVKGIVPLTTLNLTMLATAGASNDQRTVKTERPRGNGSARQDGNIKGEREINNLVVNSGLDFIASHERHH